ncbi:AraC family transcriptional regulator [Burkholderia guangdongensis]|uniref:AraC family transcriptional regulator n=1 Tax=Burkholderia guangdongensis TaxID=1792500 RepID=UPI0015C90064|nr:AraC family transcriptional regulator [Burkholderia guangdongensis]
MARDLDRLIRGASLNGYVDLVKTLGVDPRPLLRKAGLSARLLQDPETLISSDAVREALNLAAQATGAEDFALRLAARRSLSNLGPISLVLREAATPREALDALCRYRKLLHASLLTRVEDDGDSTVIREDLLFSEGRPTRQSMELAVGVMFRILTELINPGWRPRKVCFTHAPPRDIAAHQAFFGRHVAFDQPFNGIVCAAADLLRPRGTPVPELARFARDYLESALQQRGSRASETCREVILALLPGGRCTADTVARHLRVDRRTLHRHLATEGLTFSALLDEVRREIAMRHLRGSNMPAAEVAHLLGFSALSGFSHWFRAHFGCSVTEWRKQATG